MRLETGWRLPTPQRYLSSPPTRSFCSVELGPHVRPFFLPPTSSSFLGGPLRLHVPLLPLLPGLLPPQSTGVTGPREGPGMRLSPPGLWPHVHPPPLKSQIPQKPQAAPPVVSPAEAFLSPILGGSSQLTPQLGSPPALQRPAAGSLPHSASPGRRICLCCLWVPCQNGLLGLLKAGAWGAPSRLRANPRVCGPGTEWAAATFPCPLQHHGRLFFQQPV